MTFHRSTGWASKSCPWCRWVRPSGWRRMWSWALFPSEKPLLKFLPSGSWRKCNRAWGGRWREGGDENQTLTHSPNSFNRKPNTRKRHGKRTPSRTAESRRIWQTRRTRGCLCRVFQAILSYHIEEVSTFPVGKSSMGIACSVSFFWRPFRLMKPFRGSWRTPNWDQVCPGRS